MNVPSSDPRWPPESPAALLASVVLRGELHAAHGHWRPGLAALERFLAVWGGWYQARAVAGGRLDLLQGRGLLIAMPGLVRQVPAVARLARAAHAVGLGVEISLDAGELLADCPSPARPAAPSSPDAAPTEGPALDARHPLPPPLDDLLAAVDSVYLRIDAALPERQPARLRALVDRLVAARPALHLAASPAVLGRLGLLRSPAFCARYLTVFAEPPHPGRVVRVAGAGPMPCRAHLRLYIDAEGHLYPCAGLFGLPAARLGHVRDADPERWCAAAQALDLATLAARGPRLAQPPAAPFDLCEQHRLQFTSPARPEAA